jgi:hypothetical protein
LNMTTFTFKTLSVKLKAAIKNMTAHIDVSNYYTKKHRCQNCGTLIAVERSLHNLWVEDKSLRKKIRPVIILDGDREFQYYENSVCKKHKQIFDEMVTAEKV